MLNDEKIGCSATINDHSFLLKINQDISYNFVHSFRRLLEWLGVVHNLRLQIFALFWPPTYPQFTIVYIWGLTNQKVKTIIPPISMKLYSCFNVMASTHQKSWFIISFKIYSPRCIWLLKEFISKLLKFLFHAMREVDDLSIDIFYVLVDIQCFIAHFHYLIVD